MAQLGYQLTLDRTAFNLDFRVSRFDIVDVIVRILVLEQELEIVLWAVRRAVNNRIRIPLYVILAEKSRRHHSLEGFWYAIRYHPSVRLISPIGSLSSQHDGAITTGTGTTAASVAATSHTSAPLIPAAFTTTTSSHPSTRTQPIATGSEAATSSLIPNRWMCPHCATLHSYAESTCRNCAVDSFLRTIFPVGVGVDSSRWIELDPAVVQRRHPARGQCPGCVFPVAPGEDCPMCRNYTFGSTNPIFGSTTLFYPRNWF